MNKSPFLVRQPGACPGMRAFFLAGAVCLALSLAALASLACSPGQQFHHHATSQGVSERH